MTRARSFGAVAELYDRFRPSPAPGAAAYLAPLEGLDVLDVAAGTGKVTRFLLERGARVTAVEPDDAMRAVLARRSPEVTALAGVAEHLPVDDASFDVVTVSSAWHWFAQPAAADEFARVLRDDARVFILGNGMNRGHPLMASLYEFAHAENPTAHEGAARHAGEAHEDLGEPFADVEAFEVAWTWRRTNEELIGLLQTYSSVITMGEAERAQLVERLRRLLDDGAARERDVPMLMHGVRARRRAR